MTPSHCQKGAVKSEYIAERLDIRIVNCTTSPAMNFILLDLCVKDNPQFKSQHKFGKRAEMFLPC